MTIDAIILWTLQSSMIFCACFAMGWNKLDQKLPIKKILIGLLLTNAVVILLLFAIKFSISDFIYEYSTKFIESVINWYIFVIPLLIILGLSITIFTYQQLKILSYEHNRRYVFITGIFLLIAIGLWLPFGFDIVGQHETWKIKAYLSLGILDSNINGEMFTRLSVLISHTIAHFISPDGFVGYNVLHCLFIFLKGALLFGILKKFNRCDSLSFIIAILFMIYPTQTEIMSLRNFTVISGVIFYLASVYIFLAYIQSPTRLNLLAFFVLIFLNVTTHQYEFPLILTFPLLFFYFEHKLSYRLINLTLIWYLIPAWYVSYFVLAWRFSANAAYGTAYLKTSNPLITEILSAGETVLRTFKILLLDNWVAITQTFNAFFIPLILIVTMGIALMLYRLSKEQSEKSLTTPNLLQTLVVGLVIIFLFALFFGLIPGRRESDWHIYSIGSLGAAIIIGTSIILLCQTLFRNQSSKVAIFIFLICFAGAYQITLSKHQEFVELASHKSNLLKFSESVESLDAKAVWIYLTDLSDDDLTLLLDQFIAPTYRNNGTNMTLNEGQIRNSFICKPNSSIASFDCKADSENIHITNWRIDYKYKRIVFFWIESDGSTQLLETFPYEYFGLDETIDTYQPLELIQFE